jgi:TetR/AcrR family transcriptional regulator, transcriptional repressor for nem operon
MKVSRIQAAENRERILDVATKLFRERGIDGIGVADLMHAAGLTHGGFYGHFKSKEDLVAQACARAVTRMRQNWTNVIDQATGDPLEALAATYLTAKHRDGAGRGCPMAALGSEIARQGPTVRRAFTDELSPFLDYLSRIVQGNSSSLRRQKALAAYASLVGALIVSRAVDDPTLSNEILAAVASTMHHNEVERNQSKTSTRSSRTPASKMSKGRSAKPSSHSRNPEGSVPQKESMRSAR